MTHDTLRGSGPLGSLMDKALLFASDVHRSQVRKGTNVAYVSHLMTVCGLVLEDGGSEVEAAAALLHDAIEDGPAGTAERLSTEFGREVAAIVRACSDDEPEGGDKRPWLVRKTSYIAHLAEAARGAALVSAADKLHNLRCTLDDLHEHRRLGRPVVWPTSNACVHQNLWYYAEVHRALSSVMPTSRSVHGLGRALSEVQQLLGLTAPVAGTCNCGAAAA